jgi:U3 small nucleolar RNA-associated protein 20
MTMAEDLEEHNEIDVELEWQLPYHSLTVLSKVLDVFPGFAKQDSRIGWELVVDHLLFPHAWVRTAACRLLGLLFNSVPVAAPQANSPAEHPFSGVGMRTIARKLTQQLKSGHLDEALSIQVVKNLFYLGKCFYLIPIMDAAPIDEDAEDILDDEGGENVVNAHTRMGGDDLKGLSSPLPWLFSKLSYQIKSGHIARRSKAASKASF